jgi:hypothetical protein
MRHLAEGGIETTDVVVCDGVSRVTRLETARKRAG